MTKAESGWQSHELDEVNEKLIYECWVWSSKKSADPRKTWIFVNCGPILCGLCQQIHVHVYCNHINSCML